MPMQIPLQPAFVLAGPVCLSSSFHSTAFAPRHSSLRLPRRASHLTRRTLVCTHTKPAPSTTFDPATSALCAGIKAVAIGKHGTKPVPPHLIPLIAQELSMPDQPEELRWQRASFLAALFVKAELTPAEHGLLVNFCGDTSSRRGRERVVGGTSVSAGEVLSAITLSEGPLEDFALRLLNDERLSLSDSAHLGGLLYSATGDGCVRALVAHVMRVRHESTHELAGLCLAARNTLSPAFAAAKRRGFVHVAEPFDGTVTWDLLTPLLCRHLLARGWKPVMGAGASSGPKYGPNLLDVCRALGMTPARDAEDVRAAFDGDAPWGAVVDQRDASAGLTGWVPLRRAIVKRPGIATAEKYVDACPGCADVFVGSAFHAAYVEKMAHAAEAAGYDGYVIVGRGLEGTLGLGVSARKKAELLVGWRDGAGYGRELLTYMAAEAGFGCEGEPKKGEAEAGVTAGRIQRYAEQGSSGEELFDRRVGATLDAFDRAFDVLAKGGVHAMSEGIGRVRGA